MSFDEFKANWIYIFKVASQYLATPFHAQDHLPSYDLVLPLPILLTHQTAVYDQHKQRCLLNLC